MAENFLALAIIHLKGFLFGVVTSVLCLVFFPHIFRWLYYLITTFSIVILAWIAICYFGSAHNRAHFAAKTSILMDALKAVFLNSSDLPAHTLPTIIPEGEAAVEDIENRTPLPWSLLPPRKRKILE